MAKKKKLTFTNGCAHIHTTRNNSIITISDEQGNVISWASSGSIGYKGSKKKTPYSAGLAAEKAAKEALDMGLKSVSVNVNGTGSGRDTAIRSLQAVGLIVTSINDVTPIPHNGCRPPKKPR
ncbi:MAG: 30S ribosomal protein S11 [Candidatus Ureaplasma intestinipullorum]|uniref:Small ribosomal subunit protein uS11 n=1 Tax=Candidatus Ureaplasma intestinipullorum TaxID=2838770 RepID=A0A9E2NW34_9BACT|nr:30S ribosomal protein S11 [Candidatus Ureaplasma intestinipullorum]